MDLNISSPEIQNTLILFGYTTLILYLDHRKFLNLNYELLHNQAN